jgi:UDP-N-acetylmuramoylalanine-D-glutamate ligase
MSKDQIAVLGFGKTGQAVLEYLLAHEPQSSLILFNDSAIGDQGRQQAFERRGVRFLIGAEKFSELGACRLVIMSPGFNGQDPRFAALRSLGVKAISEIEYTYPAQQGRPHPGQDHRRQRQQRQVHDRQPDPPSAGPGRPEKHSGGQYRYPLHR